MTDDKEGTVILTNESLTRVLSTLYMSDYITAARPEVLKRHCITRMISIGTKEQHKLYTRHQDIKTLRIYAADHSDMDIVSCFSACNQFIASSSGHTLVHCFHGISQSAAIVLGYLIMCRQMRFWKAIDYLIRRRPCVQPNGGFLVQIYLLDTELQRKQSC